MEVLPPLDVFKLFTCDGFAGVDGEEGGEDRKAGEDGIAAEWLFRRGRVMLSYTGPGAKLLSLTCK